MLKVDYSLTEDPVLLRLCKEGDRLAEEELIRRYMRKVRICSRRFYLLGGDDEDLVQEGTIGLLNAVRSYEEGNGASFNTYAEKCILSRLIDAIHFKGYAAFESPEDMDLPEEISSGSDPEEIFLANEHMQELVSQLNEKLSKYERSVLELYLKGNSYTEIADTLGKTNPSIYNAVQRIRIKLSELI